MNASGKFLIPLAGILGWSAGFPVAADNMDPVVVQFPAETAQLKPGPGLEAVRNNCMTCHSVDYIYMQPPLTREQWLGEVTKMKKAMGAPIPDGEVDTIVQYLMSQNGKK